MPMLFDLIFAPKVDRQLATAKHESDGEGERADLSQELLWLFRVRLNFSALVESISNVVVGSIRGDRASLYKSIRKLLSRSQPLHIVYEAGLPLALRFSSG